MPSNKNRFIKTKEVSVEARQPYTKELLPRRTIMVNNFLGGISWGLGATLGLSIVLAVLGFILHHIGVIPIVGNFATDLTKYISQHMTH